MPKRTITPELELVKIDRLIERLRRRLKRTINALVKAERKRKRLVAKPVKSEGLCHCAAEPAPHQPHRAQPRYAPKPTPEEARLDELAAEYEPPKAEDLTIPTFLIRDRAAEEAAGRERDRIAAEAIRQEQEERRKTKATISREENKAKRAGITKRFPLQGKAALDAIAKGII
jgi:hypothetical protein